MLRVSSMKNTFENIEIPEKISFPEGYDFLSPFNENFEKILAYYESKLLPFEDLVSRGAYFSSLNGVETHHSIICNATKDILTDSKSSRSSKYFKDRLYSTGYATHGLFPYRGKFHPQMIKAILNITGVRKGETVLDPMCGSGTLNVEASLIGINSIGIDVNPFAAFMSQVKTEALSIDRKRLGKIKLNYSKYFSLFSNDFFDPHDIISNNNEYSKINRLILLSYLDALGFSQRTNVPISKLFKKVFNRYIDHTVGFLDIREKLDLKLGQSNIKCNSANALDDISSNSIDSIITSPPYSFAIDYVKNDKTQIEYLGYKTSEIKSETIGLQGSSKKEKLKNYFEIMNSLMQELCRILKPNKYLTIIIGSNTRQTGGVSLENNIISIGENCGFSEPLVIHKPIKGIRNTMENEYILVFKNKY